MQRKTNDEEGRKNDFSKSGLRDFVSGLVFQLQVTILIQKVKGSKFCFGDRNISMLPTSEVAPVQAMKAYRTNEGTAPLVLNRGTRRKQEISLMPRPLYPQGKIPRYPHGQHTFQTQNVIQQG
jgi:hypothetical protein